MKKILALLLAVCLMATMFVGCKKAEPQVEAPEATQDEPAEQVDGVTEQPEAPPADDEKTEAPEAETPTEQKPAEQKPAEQKPAEQKPAEQKPATQKPAEQKPTEQKPAEQKPAEQKPATQTPPAGNTALNGDLAAIIDKIYAVKDSGLHVATNAVDLADANALKAYTGLDSAASIKDAAFSEAMIGSQAYSLVLVRANSASDAKTVAAQMKSGINPRKWICVEADDLRVVACEDVVMLIMVSSELDVTANDIVNAFASVCGASFSVDLK